MKKQKRDTFLGLNTEFILIIYEHKRTEVRETVLALNKTHKPAPLSCVLTAQRCG